MRFYNIVHFDFIGTSCTMANALTIKEKTMDFNTARENMVSGQLRPNKITDNALITRFSELPREGFVDPSVRTTAYACAPAAMGAKREMFEPMVCARLLQELNLIATDNVLVAASGTGYTAAIIAPLVKSVAALEEDQNLLDIARKALADAKVDNVDLVVGKPENGLSKKAPFDKIIVDAPAEEIPSELTKQLKEGGQLVAVTQGADGLLEAVVLTKQGQSTIQHPLFETKGTTLPNFKKQERFVF